MTETQPDVLLRREGRAGRITLNRPKALNALTLDMVRQISPVLAAWAHDPEVAHVVLDGAGDRALCAGGDVISLYNSRFEGSSGARTFWREEYSLNAAIHHFPKPFIPIMHGIVMGGGIGLSAHARGGTRVVTEKSRIAFPETTIGLIPDVGGTWLLSRAPGACGPYLALLGAPLNAADAIFTGFADHFIPSSGVPDLISRLCDGAAPAAEILEGSSESAGTSDLSNGLRAHLDACFAFNSVEEIRDALQRNDSDWARKSLVDLAARSPTALKTTLAAIHRARALGSLEEALNNEYLLCTNLYEDGEFIEGVRALLVDKDKMPKWKPATLDEVTSARVDQQFSALADGDALTLKAPD